MNEKHWHWLAGPAAAVAITGAGAIDRRAPDNDDQPVVQPRDFAIPAVHFGSTASVVSQEAAHNILLENGRSVEVPYWRYPPNG